MIDIESPFHPCLPKPHTVALYKPLLSKPKPTPAPATPFATMALPRMPLERAYAVPAPLVARVPLERANAVPAPVLAAQWVSLERAHAVPAPLTDADLGFGIGLTVLPSFSAWVPQRP